MGAPLIFLFSTASYFLYDHFRFAGAEKDVCVERKKGQISQISQMGHIGHMTLPIIKLLQIRSI